MGGSFRSRLSNLTGAIPSSSTTGPVIATSIAGNQNNFRAIEESQASDVKRRRLNTNDSHRGKNFLGVIFGYVYLPLTTILLDSISGPAKALALLIDEFERHQSASEDFPPSI